MTPSNGATDVPLNTPLAWRYVLGQNEGSLHSFEVEFGTDTQFDTDCSPPTVVDNCVSLKLEDYDKEDYTSDLDLSYDTRYYWRVKAYNKSRFDSGWQNGTFTTRRPTEIASPALSYPADDAVDLLTTDVFRWTDSGSEPVNYQVRASTSVTATGALQSPYAVDATADATSYSMSSLGWGTQYYWTVRACSIQTPDHCSDWVPPGTFETLHPPATPTDLSPSAGERTEYPVQFSWTGSGGQFDTYDVYVGGAGNPVWTVLDLSSTSLSVEPNHAQLDDNTLYSWEVVAKNPAGSSVVVTETFTSPFTLQAPILDSPADMSDAQGTPVTLSWFAAGNANLYRVSLANDIECTNLVDGYPVETTDLSYDASIESGRTYYWCIQSLYEYADGIVKEGPMSEVWMFEAVDTVPKPILLTPADDAGLVDPTNVVLDWTVEDLSATSSACEPYITLTGNDSLVASYDAQYALDAVGVVVDSAVALTAGSFITLRDGSRVDPGALLSASIGPCSPAANAQATQASSIPEDLAFEVRLYWYHHDLDTEIEIISPSDKDGSGNRPALPVESLAKGRTYHWTVRTKDPSGNYSAWAEEFTFTTAPAPGEMALYSPGYNARDVDVTPTLVWYPPEGIDPTAYEIEIARDLDSESILYSAIVPETSLGSGLDLDDNPTLTYTINGVLDPMETVWWRVRAINNGSAGPFTSRWMFTTEEAINARPGNLRPNMADFPIADSSVDPREVHLSWTLTTETIQVQCDDNLWLDGTVASSEGVFEAKSTIGAGSGFTVDSTASMLAAGVHTPAGGVQGGPGRCALGRDR